jgi:glutamate N-acetyltransferase/amino-acid N-acetyltransferase
VNPTCQQDARRGQQSGEAADRDRLSIWFGGIRVAYRGERDPAYDEAQVPRR